VRTDRYEEGKQQAVARFQREYLQRALERTGGNVSQAAERCGLTRAALQRIMRQLGIDREAF
jgi:DNA-binding NtrC family response regulator